MRIVFPAQNVSIQSPTGEIDPTWYDKLKAVEAFVNLFSEINPKNITNGYTLVWNAAQQKFLPGPN